MFPTILDKGAKWRKDLPESQSPQIGSMFPTRDAIAYYYWDGESEEVAIPSNRVNVSYLMWLWKVKKFFVIKTVAIPSNRVNVSYIYEVKSIEYVFPFKSQSPQIGSMFPTSWSI